MQTKHFTPTAAELQPFYQIKCQQPDCDSVFMNMGNYELHLQKRHRIQNEAKSSNSIECCYYCPNEDCVYNFKKGISGRHFKHIKNLRQHFQKVHSKNFICEHCGAAFPTLGQLTKHATKICGKRLICLTCNWDFKSREALLTHGKRKGHQVPEAKQARKVSKTQQTKIITTTAAFDKETQTSFETPIITVVVHHNDTQTQTEQQQNSLLVAALQHDNETQTEILCSTNHDAMMYEMNAIHHDIETQTELTLQQHSPLVNSNSVGTTATFFEHILTQTTNTPAGADMHTQTCEAYLLSALGLSDIQTQTNWSSFEDATKPHMYTTNTASTSTSTAGFACDELLVSTETQTSFTQCLLESTTDMNCGCENVNNASGHASNVNGTGDESTSTFANLYTTQHTQTCDLLLDGLFGQSGLFGQENDLIGFQSTYTQT